MKLVTSGKEQYRSWVNQKFTCSQTGNEYQIDMADIDQAIANSDHPKRVHLTCPDCKGRVEFEHDMRDGHYLLHEYKR